MVLLELAKAVTGMTTKFCSCSIIFIKQWKELIEYNKEPEQEQSIKNIKAPNGWRWLTVSNRADATLKLARIFQKHLSI